MKINARKSALAFALLCVGLSSAKSADSGFGVGFVLGEPTGLSLSLPQGDSRAINLAAGYGFTGGPNLTLLGDYVWRMPLNDTTSAGEYSLYFGPGLRIALAAQPEVTPRAVIGIDYRPDDYPYQFLFELGPGVNIVPDTRPWITFSLGWRYFF